MSSSWVSKAAATAVADPVKGACCRSAGGLGWLALALALTKALAVGAVAALLMTDADGLGMPGSVQAEAGRWACRLACLLGSSQPRAPRAMEPIAAPAWERKEACWMGAA